MRRPGEGRGPVGKVAITEGYALLATSPNWAPAFAEVVEMGSAQVDYAAIFRSCITSAVIDRLRLRASWS